MNRGKVNYVNRIQVDRSKEVESQLTEQEIARQATIKAREAEVAQITFAEDSAGDFLDMAGMDEADRKYLESLRDADDPAWKKEKKERTDDMVDDSLEA